MPETAVFFLTSSVVVNEMVPAESFWNYKQWNDLRSDKWQSDCNRAVRYEDIYRMDEIKSLSFHIMFYHLFSGVAKYIVYGNTFSSFEWLRSLYSAHHGAWRRDRNRWRTTSQDTTRSSFPKRGTTSVAWSRVFKHCSLKKNDFKPILTEIYACAVSFCVRGALFLFCQLWTIT